MSTGRDRRSDDEQEVIRREEVLEVGRIQREVGDVRMRKVVEEQPFEDTVTRGIEHADFERVPADPDDAGDVRQLRDGSVSIPVFEEQLVVEKRVIVRERVLVRKRVESVSEEVRADLRREVVEVDVDPEAEDRVHVDDRPPEDSARRPDQLPGGR
jgi:stress response protein YsnF